MSKLKLFFVSMLSLLAWNVAQAENIEVDYTNRVGITAADWKGSSGLCATNFAPAITTKDGRSAQLAENYQTNVNATGDLITQTVTGLANGTYRVSIYANAFFTSGRGFDSEMEDGSEDVCYVFAGVGDNRVEKFITARIATSTTENDLRTMENVVVSDGSLVIGLGKAKAGTNWHTVQVYEITAIVDKDEFIATKYKPLEDALAAGEAIKKNVPEEDAAIATYDAAVADAKAANEARTLDYDVEAAVAVVKAAAKVLSKAQTAPGSDLSAFIVNPEINGSDGWTLVAPVGGGGPLKPSGDALEFWAGSANPRSEAQFDIYQEISGLPNGIYTISADLFNSLNDEGGAVFAPTSGVYASSSENEAYTQVDVEGTEFKTYTTGQVLVTDGKLRIGVKSVKPLAARWFVADNFKLTLVKTVSDDDMELQQAYIAALGSIEDGGTYRIFTEVDGVKYYLNAAGKLVDNTKKAATFAFNAVEGDEFKVGFYIDGGSTRFSNPPGTTEDKLKCGYISTSTDKRNTWEAQVLFLKDGKYAVRATNVKGGATSGWSWVASSFWTVETVEEALVAQYDWDPAYVWEIEENVDNRPAAFAKVQEWAGKLQTIDGLVQDATKYTSNAKDPAEGSYEALLDGDYSTFFHSTWHGGEYDPQADHYLQAELPEAKQEFYIYFKKRSQNNNNRPTKIIVSGSNDGETFTEITTIVEGLPAGATPIDFLSAKIAGTEAYKYLRFTVPETNSGAKTGDHVFFTFSEFYILPADGVTAAAVPYIVSDYTDLEDSDVDKINDLDGFISAAAVIEDGLAYRISTTVGEEKYFLAANGKLTADKAAAGTFTFTKVAADNPEYPFGFLVDGGEKRFSNPPGTSEDKLKCGYISTSTDSRKDWEAQVFFLKDGKYAVRSTNAPYADSGWGWVGSAYWTVDDVEGAPVAEYSFDRNFVWELKDLSTVKVTYALYDEGGEEPVATVEAVQEINSAVQIPASFSSKAYYQFATEGTIGEEDCTIKVVRSYKTGLVLALDQLSNNKAYTITCDRGALLTKDGYLASTAHGSLADAEPANFAIINYEDHYYLFSVADNQFVTFDPSVSTEGARGPLANLPVHGTEDAIILEAKDVPYFFAYFKSGDTSYGLNTNGNDPYGHVINTWMTADPGNLYYMIEAADFDPSSALAQLQKGEYLVPLMEALAANEPNPVLAGDAVFQKPQAAYDTFKAAYDTQAAVAAKEDATIEELQAAIKALDDAVATYAAVEVNKPEAGVQYMFQHKSSGAYLGFAGKESEGVTTYEVSVVDPAQCFDLTATEGGYNLSNEIGFIALQEVGKNNLIASEENKFVLIATPVEIGEDGTIYYHLINTTDGKAITSASTATSFKKCTLAGSPNKNALWAIEVKTTLDLAVDVVRPIYPNQYQDQYASIDVEAVKKFLGVETLTAENVSLSIINPDGTEITDYAGYDGWFGKDGSAQNWGDNAFICVKMFQALTDGQFFLCHMNGPTTEDQVSVKWAFKANGKTVIYTVNVTFEEYVEPSYKPEIIKTIDIAHTEMPETAYSEAEPAPKFDVAEVCNALGIADISEAKAYIVNVTTGNFVENSTDGWRNADGDAAPWGECTNGFCVKLDNPASGEFNYTGAHDANFKEGDTYLAQWGLVANEKAVLLKVNVTFSTPVGIRDMQLDGKAEIYDLNGRKVSKIQRGGIYIVNGKRVAVK